MTPLIRRTGRDERIMMPGVRLLAALGALLLLAGATPAAAERTTRGDEPVYAETPCPVEVAGDPTVTCGTLTVPEDRRHPDGAQVRLFVTRYSSTDSVAAADPVVLLQGGPGDVPALADFLDHPSRDGRELIVVDQRGAGRSEPSLACPEIAADERARLGRDLDDDAVVDAAAQAARACHDRLVATGIELAAYDSAESAADVADLRDALGFEEWNLAGNSYGTRLALTVARDHPGGVRSLALGGPYPPNADGPAGLAANAERAFGVLFDGCAAVRECRAISPDLRSTFEELTRRLEADPVTIAAADSDGQPGTVHLDGDVLPLLLHGALYETELIPSLPAILEAAARGVGLDTLATLVLDRAETPESFSHGLFLSVHCQDEAALTTAGRLTAAERDVEYLRSFARAREIERAQCQAWDVGRSPRREAKAVRSDIPTLILAGEYDPITPPKWGRLAAKTLPNAFVFELAGMGHDVTAQTCPRRLRQEFLADPTSEPSHPCLAELAPPLFMPS